MLAWIADVSGARRARRGEHIQTLWSGYGEVFRVELDGGPVRTAVVKHVRPPPTKDAVSDARKRRSYEVEAAFYREVAPRCDDRCRVARLYGFRRSGDELWFVLEDLDAAGFTRRIVDGDAEPAALDRCLAWLAAFHARFVDRHAPLSAPGTYWHLATRTDELAAIADADLRARAADIAARLDAARFQTLLHGDPKEANFCFAPHAVAAVDFQYTGRGCAMKDVAYLLYGRADEPADGIARGHLDTYFHHLRAALAERGDVDAAAVEAEWRSLYVLARLDFCRFLAGWRPSAWQHDLRGQRFVRTHR